MIKQTVDTDITSGRQAAAVLHSDICGSTLACNSPQLFAAYRVLLRLPMPRHPPCALISLTFFIGLNYAFSSLEVVKIVVLLPTFFR